MAIAIDEVKFVEESRLRRILAFRSAIIAGARTGVTPRTFAGKQSVGRVALVFIRFPKSGLSVPTNAQTVNARLDRA